MSPIPGRSRHDIAIQRIGSQALAGPRPSSPLEAVSLLGAVQSQDLAGAKWALGQRLVGGSEAAVDQALSSGSILRTHLLRPTWHLVAAKDIRWMLALTAPRVHLANGYQCRKLGLEPRVLKRAVAVLKDALAGRALVRKEMATVFQEAGIALPTLLHLTCLLMHAELEAVICSGVPRGTHQTWSLLDERAPQTAPLDRSAALAALARRYFTGHGPATLKDFAWWSGLTLADAGSGARAAEGLVSEEVDGETHWAGEAALWPSHPPPGAWLLSNFDEFIIGYANRAPLLTRVRAEMLDSRASVLANHTLMRNAEVLGTWSRTIGKKGLRIELMPFEPLTRKVLREVEAAANGYGAFLGVPAELCL